MGQLLPNVIHSTVFVIMVCRACAVEVSLEIWRHMQYLSKKCKIVQERSFLCATRRSKKPSIVGPLSIYAGRIISLTYITYYSIYQDFSTIEC